MDEAIRVMITGATISIAIGIIVIIWWPVKEQSLAGPGIKPILLKELNQQVPDWKERMARGENVTLTIPSSTSQ